MYDGGISWGYFLAIMGGVLALTGGVLRLWYRAVITSIEEKHKTANENMLKLEKRMETYYGTTDKLRDRWDNFLKDYFKENTTMNQKVNALFRVVDMANESIRALPGEMNQKVEDMFLRAMNELKMYIRDYIAEERQNARNSRN